MSGRPFWPVRSEPESFSFDDLLPALGRTTTWDGVRIDQAGDHMRDGMRPDDGVLFHHSKVNPAGVAGLAEVAAAARRPDRARRGAYRGPSGACATLHVLRRGNRLSVTPVSEAEWWNAVCRLRRRGAAGSGRA